MAKNFYDRTLDALGKNLKLAPPRTSQETAGPVPRAQVGGKQLPKPRKKKVEKYRSGSSDNEANLSFVDEKGEDEDDPFVKSLVKGARHYSTSRHKKRRVMSLVDSEEDEDEDEEGEDEDEEDEDEDEEGSESEVMGSDLKDHVFKRSDGKDFRYGRDEFVRQEDSSEERLERINARRKARGEALIRLDSDDESSYKASSILMEMSSSSSSSVAGSRVEDASSEGELLSMDTDETRAVIEDARHIIKMHKHRVKPVEKPRLETKRAAQVREIQKALFSDVDSEADTVDGKVAEESSGDSDEEMGNNPGNSLSITQACVDKIYRGLDVTLVDGTSMGNPLKEFEMAALFEAFKTLSATNLNAAVEQQTSKNIQAQINQGHSNIPGQSASRKQSEIVQESLHFLDGFMKKDAILEILQRAVEEV